MSFTTNGRVDEMESTKITKTVSRRNLPVKPEAKVKGKDSQDLIYHPNHYTARGGVEPMVYALSNGFTGPEWEINKYLYRYPFKGNPLRDLKKAKHYIEMLIAEEEAKAGGSK